MITTFAGTVIIELHHAAQAVSFRNTVQGLNHTTVTTVTLLLRVKFYSQYVPYEFLSKLKYILNFKQIQNNRLQTNRTIIISQAKTLPAYL
jgi:hypothetical protein